MPDLRRLWPVAPALAAALAVLSCGPPEAAVAPVSEAARKAPPPRLGETAAFDAALARADPDARRLEAGSAELAARAEALRARAAALGAPVVDPAVRPRLEAGSAGG
jgi:hypothetical protein